MKTLVYSNSDYNDVLEIQNDYINKFLNCDLIYNKAINNTKFKNVYTYNDLEPYGSRLYNVIKQINEDYILFIHDNDIVLNVDCNYLNILVDLMKKKNIDKIDLKHQNLIFKNQITIQDNILSQTSFPNDSYVYNVNPAIWKTEKFVKCLENYTNETYRTIEHSSIQKICSDNNTCLITHSEKPIKMSYYSCYNEFKFLHISHHGEFLPNDYSQTKMLKEDFSEYQNLIAKYDLKNKNRKFRTTMY